MFKSVSKSDVVYPAVLLFVDLSYLPSPKEELMYRNDELRGKVHSCVKVYSKPRTDLGHVKVFFNLS